MWNPFPSLTRRDWLLWGFSSLVLLLCNLVSGPIDLLQCAATLTGAAFLIFLAKGNVWGQILTVVFSVLYAILSWRARYWGELLTYVGMTMPMALLAVFSWIRHPYKQENEVAIHRLRRDQLPLMLFTTGAATLVFSLLLSALDTPNLFWSCLSVATSFLAAYLTFMRSSLYALAYAANDLVLIILWLLMAFKDFSNFPMVVNFLIFLINDCYGYWSWKKREQKQLS